MRAHVLAVVLAAALGAGACDFTAAEADLAPGDDDSGLDIECVDATECILAASTCCSCSEYAMRDDGLADSCEDVPCPDPDPSSPACPPLIAACLEGVCTTACAPTPCDLACPSGFVIDAAGCLSCECASGPPLETECAVDGDCVQVPADCCGCSRGGADTAVGAGDATAFGDSLMCPSDPGDAACPEVDVCDPALAPRCESGRCVLSDGTSEDRPAPTCGHPDLPPCSEGTVCVLNVDSDASMDGLGTCQPE